MQLVVVAVDDVESALERRFNFFFNAVRTINIERCGVERERDCVTYLKRGGQDPHERLHPEQIEYPLSFSVSRVSSESLDVLDCYP